MNTLNFQHSLEGPGILPSNLLFFFRGKIIFYVESFADLLRSLAFDHVGDSLTSEIQQTLYVQVICSLTRKYRR